MPRRIATAALSRIESESLLQDIFQNSRHTAVRQKAGERLKKAREAKDNGESTTILLFRKREALVQQAKRLTEDKKFMNNSAEFSALMKEAEKLGMGPAQADLDALYQSFQEKCAKETERIQAEAEAKEASKAKYADMLHLLEEFEMYVNEDKVQNNLTRLNEIVSQWKNEGGDKETTLAKRFSSAYSRFQRALASLELTQAAQQSISQNTATREEILEQFRLLADKEPSEALERQVKGLTRSWEALPLMEGNDPLLQTYNSLRDQLSQKLNALSDEMRKNFEEKTAKLRAIIESIKQIDENQDSVKLQKCYGILTATGKRLSAKTNTVFRMSGKSTVKPLPVFRKCSSGNPGTMNAIVKPSWKKCIYLPGKSQAKMFCSSSAI
jgi:hypothetical protein